ncbi:hypothetical protein P691DRAFT_802381 [Macrolepiota fuliginosa MF-IS2]|uniref:Pre-rRNA-processing protein RIX1 n=1 Tax=Macrolepiota fuliginosa MF-IS2 TaxID=1400762 RepID=A0A9P5XPT4_9AGAR|nr:hypothetical protein P691DRAFT_802381 [Macrolepiota fuliginosa MF-IS2]
MSEYHPLKTLLNIHLASDASTVLHLPFILDAITPGSLNPSPHLSKWTARIQALLHSKDPGGRWAGLVLAQKTGILSQTLLLENGQSWVGVALPLLSKNEPPVVHKTAIRLLRTIFSHSHQVSEFRRQVATPNVPKLLAALIPLVEQTSDTELKVVAVAALVNLVPLYPTLCKASYPTLSNLALRFLDGNPHTPVPFEVLSAASRLYSIIHVTGGKVGASSLWRKTLDETLVFGTSAFWSLRTTFSGTVPANVSIPPNEDPITFIPLQLDRLKCAVTILDDLLGTTVYRPVQLPLGTMVKFALQILQTTDSTKREGFIDATTHVLEVSVVPKIQQLGYSLVVSLTERIDRYLQPYLAQIMTILTIHLEQQATAAHHFALLRTLEIILRHYPSSHSPLIATRLMKAVLPSISKVLVSSDNLSNFGVGPTQSKGRKGKKKQSYEGDELFSASRPVIYSTDVEGKVLLAALEVTRSLLRDPHLSAAVHSISIRVLIAILFSIGRIPPATLSPDPTLYQDVLSKLHDISTEFVAGTSSALSKSLPLIVGAMIRGDSGQDSQRQLDLLLHPRLPPLMRSMPTTEGLALIFSEESEEEAELRKSLGFHIGQHEISRNTDVEMDDSTTQRTVPLTTPGPGPALVVSRPIPTPAQPVPTTSLTLGNDRTGQVKEVTTPEPTPIRVQETIQEPPPERFRSSIIEPPKPQFSQRAPESSPAEASSSTPKVPVYTAPNPSLVVEDEDEDMPAIDMGSDSDEE